MKCCALNAHVCRKNVVPRPSCICNGFESSFFFCSSVLGTLYLITLRTILLMTSYLGRKVNQFLEKKDPFYRCKTLSLNQVGW